MAFITTDRLSTPSRGIWRTVFDALVRMAENSSRMRELEAMRAKSDAELAEMGLTRDDIPRYVMRDVFYL